MQSPGSRRRRRNPADGTGTHVPPRSSRPLASGVPDPGQAEHEAAVENDRIQDEVNEASAESDAAAAEVVHTVEEQGLTPEPMPEEQRQENQDAWENGDFEPANPVGGGDNGGGAEITDPAPAVETESSGGNDGGNSMAGFELSDTSAGTGSESIGYSSDAGSVTANQEGGE